jgi:uncharacterized protein (DUF4415 family)
VDVPGRPPKSSAPARPFKEVFPEQYKAWKRMGRPPVESSKVHISFRLASDVVDGIRATGQGFNARVEKVLRDALNRGGLNSQRTLPPATVIPERISEMRAHSKSSSMSWKLQNAFCDDSGKRKRPRRGRVCVDGGQGARRPKRREA